MPAKDTYHDEVKRALQKDGWTITDDPLYVRFLDQEMWIDLGGERLLAAEKYGEKIAVEIKSFLGSSPLADFHEALGQFMNYRMAWSRRSLAVCCIWRCRWIRTRRSFFPLLESLHCEVFTCAS